jgi:AraC-like DNA-binding protein
MPDADALFGLCLSGRHGLGPLLASTVRSIWTHLRQGMPAQLGDGVAKGLLDFVAAAYAMEHRPRVESSAASARRSQIKRFIERHLRDSDLTAQSVAERLGLSSRYTRLVFAAEGESVSSYILRRRLEECAHQLTNALWNRRSITETAFEWGFSSMSHFTRSFKDRFDVTPTEYRRSRAS